MDIFEMEYPGAVHEYDLKDGEDAYAVLVHCSEEEIQAGENRILAVFKSEIDAM